ncbi:MAG: hypothetical protein ACI4UE_00570 [Candidatus Scatovivens sp.]
MITLQHSLITLFSQKGNEEKFRKEIPYVLLPDAIRKYCGPRQYSHFEQTESGDDISWMKFPEKIKEINQNTVDGLQKHLSTDIKPCVLGEMTHIEKFEETNQHLEPEYYYGVKKHLKQDYIFDEFVREQIDTSKKYEDKFYFNDEELNGKQVRGLIGEIESHGLYVLAYMVYQAYGITANQEWFDKNVKAILDKQYPKDLSDATYKYMKIPEHINDMITNHDWSELNNGIIPLDKYVEMYKKVTNSMVEIDFEKEKKEQQKSEGTLGDIGEFN